MRIRRAFLTACAVVAVVSVAAATSAIAADEGTSNWIGFGGAPENVRHSPATQITKDNVGQLGRLFTVNFRAVDPTIRAGQQSFVTAANGRIYATTSDGNVFAVNATNGDVIWRWRPE